MGDDLDVLAPKKHDHPDRPGEDRTDHVMAASTAA
jgi:hypothetical protein